MYVKCYQRLVKYVAFNNTTEVYLTAPNPNPAVQGRYLARCSQVVNTNTVILKSDIWLSTVSNFSKMNVYKSDCAWIVRTGKTTTESRSWNRNVPCNRSSEQTTSLVKSATAPGQEGSMMNARPDTRSERFVWWRFCQLIIESMLRVNILRYTKSQMVTDSYNQPLATCLLGAENQNWTQHNLQLQIHGGQDM